MTQGYCMKCKAKREMEQAEEVVMKNKRKALKGSCSKCSTRMFKILAGPGGPIGSKKSKKPVSKKSKKTKKTGSAQKKTRT